MRHDIIMPALGMAQDTGTLVAWNKSEGDAVTQGDLLFEVETDKTTMEVEASASGFLVGVSAREGEEVPVGKVIAAISDSPEESRADPEGAVPEGEGPTESEDLPAGHPVIMPVLGMAQDSGVLVRWLKDIGESVQADEILFEVETDKSVAEVEANQAGYLVARLAAAGDDVPTGETIAIIAEEVTDHTVDRPFKPAATEKKADEKPADQPTEQVATEEEAERTASSRAPKRRKKSTAPAAHGKILASPKLKRMAHQAGYDLAVLIGTDLPEPYLSRDFDALKRASESKQAESMTVSDATRLSAQVCARALETFVHWARETIDATEDSVLASFAGASLAGGSRVRIDRHRTSQVYDTHLQLSRTTLAESDPDLIVQDLRGTHITSLELPAGSCPVIALIGTNDELTMTLSCAGDCMSAVDAADLLNNFAGRMADPIRHLF